jgi:DNA-directed RNA polymerase subunit B
MVVSKRLGLVHEHVCAGYDRAHNVVHINTGAGRYVYPVVAGDFLRRDQGAASKALLEGRWSRLVSAGHVYYVDPLEMHTEDMVLAHYLDDFWDPCKRHHGYTACCVHPSMNYGVAASLVPFINHNGPVRQSYNTQIIKQVISAPHGRVGDMHYPSQAFLAYPQMPLTRTVQLGGMRLDERPHIVNLLTVMGHWNGFGIEDPWQISSAVVDTWLMQSFRVKRVFVEESRGPKDKNHVVFRKPHRFRTRTSSAQHIKDDGSIVLGCNLKKGDILWSMTTLPSLVTPAFIASPGPQHASSSMGSPPSSSSSSSSSSASLLLPSPSASRKGRKRPLSSLNEEEMSRLMRDENVARDSSVLMTQFDAAQVIGINRYVRSVQGATVQGVEILLLKSDTPEVGDKGAGPGPQKGVCSAIIDREDMDFDFYTKETMELIINPFNFTRNTEGQQLQCLATGNALIELRQADGTAFESEDAHQRFASFFGARGMHFNGKRTICSGVTGLRREVPVYTLMIDYQRLRHLVSSKLNTGTPGPINSQTHEYAKGGNSLRFGEMERECIVAYGGSETDNSMRSETTDTVLPMCPKCSTSETIIPYDTDSLAKDKYYDKKDYWCSRCKEAVVPDVVNIPYSAHLTLQELAANMTVCVKKVA